MGLNNKTKGMDINNDTTLPLEKQNFPSFGREGQLTSPVSRPFSGEGCRGQIRAAALPRRRRP